MIVMVENEQVTGTLPSRDRAHRERLGIEKAGEIPHTPSEYEREDSNTRNFTSAADARRERENQRPHRHATITSNGDPSMYGYGSSHRSQPPQMNGEAGRAYADFMRNQQQSNGNQTQTQTPNPYSHRMNEGHPHQPQQRASPRGEQQPVGPGKVMTPEFEGDDDGMMGQDGVVDQDGLVNGLGSPKSRDSGTERERV